MMMQRKIVWLTIAYILGILVTHYCGIADIRLTYILGIICVLIIAAGILIYYRKSIMIVLLVLFFIGGISYCSYRENIRDNIDLEVDTTYDIVCMVTKYPQLGDSYKKYVVKLQSIDGCPVEQDVKVNILVDREFTAKYGDIVSATAKVLPSLHYNNPNQFNYEKYLEKKGIIATLSCLGNEYKSVLTDENHGNVMFKYSYRLRSIFEDNLSHIPVMEAGFIRGILFGDKSSLDQSIKSTLSQSGIMHVFAVSGLHLGYIALIVAAIGAGLKLGRWSKFLLMFIVLLIYGAMTGFQASVIRAMTMILVYMFIENTAQGRDQYTVLSIAALLLLLINPVNLFDVGFQLSFLAVLGIIYFSPMVKIIFPQKFPLRDAFIVMISAQLGVMPLIIYHFNIISFVTFILSPIVCILVGGIVILGFLSIILSLFYASLGLLPLYLGGLIAHLVWFIVDFATNTRMSFVYIATPSIIAMIITYILLFSLPQFEYFKQHRVQFGLAMILIFSILFIPVGDNDELEITFLSVGQGDAIYMRTPNGINVMIDGGGKRGDNGIGYYVLAPFLQDKGVNNIDLMVNTHPHDDHINGFFPLIEQFNVEKIAIASANIADSMSFLEVADKEGIDVVYLSSGDTIMLDDDITIKVLHPDINEADKLNNQSLVLHISYGNTSFLLTGDIEKNAIAEIINENKDISSDVLKLPHHGADTSFAVDFYQKVNPDLVVISVGENSYGHPYGDIIKYWFVRNTKLLRTDKDGAISLYSDGERIRVQTYGEESIVE